MEGSIWAYNGVRLDAPAQSYQEAAERTVGTVPGGVLQICTPPAPDADDVLTASTVSRVIDRLKASQAALYNRQVKGTPSSVEVEWDCETYKGPSAYLYENRVIHYEGEAALNTSQIGGYATLSAEKCAETMAKMEAALERQATARRGEEIMRAVRLASGGK